MNLSFLDYYAKGLNLSDPEDCDKFRLLVTYYLQGVKLSEIDKMVGMHSRSRRTGIYRLCELYRDRTGQSPEK